MFLQNPLRPGSVTTDILADGAVTCVKTSFGSCTLPLSDATLSGSLTGGQLKPGTVLAVQYGGTGTSTPALNAGTGISITGGWPNQTINNTSAYATLPDPLPVNHGGTGLTSPSLTAGVSISITGTWPNQTINNIGAFASLTVPLAVNKGGTGTTTPALVAGSNITVSGSFPNQTVSLVTNPAVQYIDLQRTIASAVLLRCFNNVGTYIGGFGTDGSYDLQLLLYAGDGSVASTFTQGLSSLQIASTHVDLTGNFSEYNGNVTAGNGIPSILATYNSQDRTTNIGTTTLLNAPVAGMYRINSLLSVLRASGTAAQALQFNYTYRGTVFTVSLGSLSTSSTGRLNAVDTVSFYADAGTNIQINSTGTIGSGNHFDAHIVLELL